MSHARRLLLARLLVCLSASLCGLAAVLLLSAYLSINTVASATGQPVARASSGEAASKANAALSPTPPAISPDTPLRLLIPSVGINAPVEMLSFGSNGDLATPTQHPWDDVGWYDQGPRPGERGSAVIDGHLDRPGAFPAVFWNLGHVQIGEDVQVTNSAGKTLHFRVTGVMYYTPDQAPLQEIFGNQSGTYLNLITCAGDWIPDQHQTTLRLVVFTTLV
jgi:sortase (surface protein transpeptidase)